MRTLCAIFFLLMSGLLLAQERSAAYPDLCSRHVNQSEEAFLQPPISNGTNFSRVNCQYNSVQSFATLNKEDLYTYITSVSDPLDCINRVLYSNHTVYSSQVFTDEKVTYVANQILTKAQQFNGQNDNGVMGAYIFLSIAGLQATFYSDYVSFNQTTWDAIGEACRTLAVNPTITSQSIVSSYTLGHLLFAASFDDIPVNDAFVDLSETMLDMLAADSYETITGDLYAYYYSYYYLLDVFLRYSTDIPEFIDKVELKPNLITSLGEVATNLKLNNTTYKHFGDLSNLSVVSITRYSPFPELREEVEDALIGVTDAYEEYDSKWFRAALSLVQNDMDFEYSEEELVSNLRSNLFSSTYSFDDGKIQIESSLDYGEAIGLYQAALEVRAQFFRMLEEDQAVAEDDNDTLYIKIHSTRANYQEFNGAVFGVSYPNSGGVYIEQFSTFYTYDRTAEESAYSLEELFRHEYTHYLQGRYLIPGGWGSSPTYDNGRLVWFEEGMAQFFAASTRTDGVKALRLIKNSIVNDSQMDDLNTILSSSYSTGNPDAYYLYGAMLWTYWYQEDRGTLQEMMRLIKSGNNATFDGVVNYYKNSAAENEDFLAFVDALTQQVRPWIVSDTEGILPREVTFGTVDDIRAEAQSVITGLDIHDCVIDASDDPGQFEMTGLLSIEGTHDLTEAGIKLNEALDVVLEQLATSSDYNNFQYATGHYDETLTGSSSSVIGATFHVYGPLNDMCREVASTDFQSESLDNQVRLHTPDDMTGQHQFRYREVGTVQWFVILENSVSPDVVFNLDPNATYEFQMRQECGPGVWSDFSDSKTFQLCLDEQDLSGVVSSSEDYQAAFTITSSQTISDGSNVRYQASQEVLLQSSFEIAAGGTLEVSNENCTDRN